MLVNDNIKLIWYWIETVYALVQRFFGYKKDASKIPKGAYCYVIDEERNKKEPLADGGRWIKTCPYFRSTKKTGGIACTYLGFFGFDCLLYDQCKICEVNEKCLIDDEDIEEDVSGIKQTKKM